MRIRLLLPLFAILLLLAPRSAQAEGLGGDPNPLFLALGGLKTPGIAFDIVGAAFARPHLEVFEEGNRMRLALRASFTSNLVTLGLHGLSIGSFFVGAFADDWKDAIGPVFLINAGCDIAIGVMGLVTGVDVLLARTTVDDIKGTPAGIGSTWTGIANLGMGTFGILWFAPMLITGLVGVSKMAVADAPATSRIALRLRPTVQATVVPGAGNLTLVGRF